MPVLEMKLLTTCLALRRHKTMTVLHRILCEALQEMKVSVKACTLINQREAFEDYLTYDQPTRAGAAACRACPLGASTSIVSMPEMLMLRPRRRRPA